MLYFKRKDDEESSLPPEEAAKYRAILEAGAPDYTSIQLYTGPIGGSHSYLATYNRHGLMSLEVDKMAPLKWRRPIFFGAYSLLSPCGESDPNREQVRSISNSL